MAMVGEVMDIVDEVMDMVREVMDVAGELMDMAGEVMDMEFIPIAAWYPTAVEQIQKLGSALARQTVEEETATNQQLFQKLSVSLMRGNVALFNNRSPSDAGGDILIKIQSVCQKLATLQHDFPPKVDKFWIFFRGQGALFSAVRR